MNTYTDSRLITISSDSANSIENGTLMSNCKFIFDGMLKDETDILYTNISVQNAQIPISYYVVNIYNNSFKYKVGSGPIKTVNFETGNYNASSFILLFEGNVPEMTVTLNKFNGRFMITGTQPFIIYGDGTTCHKLLGIAKSTDYSASVLMCPFPCQFQGITRIKVVSNALSTYAMDSISGSFSNVLASVSVNSGAYGILLYDNTSQYKPLLREKTLNYFDIALLDDDENHINFNNVSWHMTLQIDIIRKLQVVDTTFPQVTSPQPTSDQPEENNIDLSTVELPISTGDSDLDFLLYQNNIYQ